MSQYASMNGTQVLCLYTADSPLDGDVEISPPLPCWPAEPHPGAILHLTDGQFSWEDIRDSTQKAEYARGVRDQLLSSTDWMIVRALESGTPVAAPWLEYRQALRNVPSQEGFPDSIEWPSQPETGV